MSTHEEGSRNQSDCVDGIFDGVGKFGGNADVLVEAVMLLVDELVEKRGVERPVSPIEDGVLDQDEKEYLGNDFRNGREYRVGRHLGIGFIDDLR